MMAQQNMFLLVREVLRALEHGKLPSPALFRQLLSKVCLVSMCTQGALQCPVQCVGVFWCEHCCTLAVSWCAEEAAAPSSASRLRALECKPR